MEEGGEDAAVGAVAGAGASERSIGFEDRDVQVGMGHGCEVLKDNGLVKAWVMTWY